VSYSFSFSGLDHEYEHENEHEEYVIEFMNWNTYPRSKEKTP